MKKLISIFILLISLHSFGQDVVGGRVIAKTSLFVKDNWVDSIRRDTVGLANDNRTIMTSGAVYKFLLGRIPTGAGTGSVTNVGSGFGLTGGPITTSGTLVGDSTSGGFLSWVRGKKLADSLGALISAGGVYQIITTRNVTGGTGNYGSITSGADNFALGNALHNNTTSGSRDILLGRLVAPRITTASDIIAIGYNNLLNINASNLNSAPGINIGSNNNGYSKFKNLAIGSYNNGQNVDSALAVASTMADNMSIGVENLFNLRVGTDNMAFSWDGGQLLDSGYNNNIFGQYGLESLINGSGNQAFGWRAGHRTNHGDRNIFIGDSAGRGSAFTTMNHSIFIGSNSRFTGTNLVNRITIGDSALNSQDNLAVIGKSGTFLAIARATATESIHTDGAILIGARATTTDGTIAYQSNAFVFRQNGVDVALGGGSSTWNGITDPTGDQALTFQAGESSTWTDQNTTEDLFTVNNATSTTNSQFSINRTSTALAAGNNIMELVSSGANGTASITSTGLRISNTNTGTTNTNVGLDVIASGATNNYAMLAQGYVGISTPAVGAFTPTASLEIKDANTGVTSFQITGTDGQYRLKIREYGTIFEGFSAVLQLYNSFSGGSLGLGGGNVGNQMLLNGTRVLMQSSRFITAQGADVASTTGAMTLGTGGNVFEITGTNAITLISNLGYANGAEITLLFTSTASLTDGTANSGTDIGFELAGGTNFTGSADDTITLVLSEIGGVQRWREKCRSVN